MGRTRNLVSFVLFFSILLQADAGKGDQRGKSASDAIRSDIEPEQVALEMLQRKSLQRVKGLGSSASAHSLVESTDIHEHMTEAEHAILRTKLNAGLYRGLADCKLDSFGAGANASLCEQGYLQVASLCCNYQMELYIVRVVNSMGLKVCMNGGVMGLVRFFTCGSYQSLAVLKSDIRRNTFEIPCPSFGKLGEECPEWSMKCWNETSDATTQGPEHRRRRRGSHRRRICQSGNDGPGTGNTWSHRENDGSNADAVGGGDIIVEGGGDRGRRGGRGGRGTDVVNTYMISPFPVPQPIPAPAPEPCSCGCLATFQHMAGSNIMQATIKGGSEAELDAKCCNECTRHYDCEFWVRQYNQDGRYINKPTICWLRKDAGGQSYNIGYRGGWRRPGLCFKAVPVMACLSSFQEFSGSNLPNGKIGICGKDSSALDAACHKACYDRPECTHWFRDAHERGVTACQLRYNPGSEFKNRPQSRGGWKQGCGQFAKCDASFQEKGGRQIARMGVFGSDHQSLDAACCYLCSQNRDCEYWVREWGNRGNKLCYLRAYGGGFSWSWTKRGGWNKVCGNPDAPPAFATFQELGGFLVSTERVCGLNNQDLDTQCSLKCLTNSLCEYWIRERGASGFVYCWLRKFNTKPRKSASANRRGGYRHQQSCGSAHIHNGCRASFQHMSGSQVALEFVCGNNDTELDAMCCELCRNHTDCQFWVRETRKATDTDQRPKQCWLRKNPGSAGKNVNYVGGWKQGCGPSGRCDSTFQERSGPQVDKVGVCGSNDPKYLDNACCQKCAENPLCEFWVRDISYPTEAHGATNSSICYLRWKGALNPSVNANRRGGWNKICGAQNVQKCASQFQDMGGIQILQDRICGQNDDELDAQCCHKCKQNDFCEYWVREKGSRGYMYCWLRRRDSPNRAPNANANRRGGYTVDAVCGDAYLKNGCRSTFREMSGAQVGLEYVCGDTDDELDAMCCAKCRNNTQCEFWVREVRSSAEKDISRPKSCWLRKNAGSGSNSPLRAGGWRQGCDQQPSKCIATFQERGGAQVTKVGVCGADPYSKKQQDKEFLDAVCCDLCAQHPQCEFWIREVDLPTVAQGGANTSFCYLRKNGAATSSGSSTKRGGWNKVCGDPQAPKCRSTFQDMAGSLVDTVRVCGRNDTALDSDCCRRCRQHDFCDHWVREKGSSGWKTCWLRAKHPNPMVRPNANVNRRGGYKNEAACGEAYLGNGCRSSFFEMSGTQVSFGYVCGTSDDELDAMCCDLCRNTTDCEFWVRERRYTWEEDATRPKLCWLRKNPGSASNNAYRRGGWKRGCGPQKVENCWASFQDRGGRLVEKLGVCGSFDRKSLDSLCCDLCAQNPECEFWVRETDIPAKNNTFCYLRKIGAVNPTSRTNKRGGWSKLCGNSSLPVVRAVFQNMGGGLIDTTRICGNTSRALDTECAAKCRAHEFCEFWLRETHPTYPDDGFKYCWLYRKATARSASTVRRGGWREQKACGTAYLGNGCNSSFHELSGSQAALVFVCGDTDAELDAMCCDECKNNTKCEFWVRESGTQGAKQCWLRYNPGGFSKNLNRRGGWKQGCATSKLSECKATFQDYHGPEVDKLGVCGNTDAELDSACCDLCEKHKDCEFWVREHGLAGQSNQKKSKFCWLRKIGSSQRSNSNRRGGRKVCKSSNLPACKSSFDNLGGSHIETNRTCGNSDAELDAGCCAKCNANPNCAFWLREAGTAGGNMGYKYCWLYRNPSAYPSRHSQRRGGFRKQELPPCSAAFKDMDGSQIAQIKIYGQNDAVLDAACCSQCSQNQMCQFWVREYHGPTREAGGKWCWLRRTTNGIKRNRNNRRGGMKMQGLLQQSADLEHMDAKAEFELESGVETSEQKSNEEEGASNAAFEFREVSNASGIDTDVEELPFANISIMKKFEEVALAKYIHDRRDEEGSTAFLDEHGYKAVAALQDNAQMEDFVRRAVASLNLYIVDEGGLQGIVPFYSGVQDKQTMEQLLLELEQTAHGEKNNTWVRANPRK